MDTHRKERQGEGETKRSLVKSLFVSLFPCLLVFVLVSACAPIRPIYKIGLLAPFEGLYRRNGYEALEAMRAAIAETPQNGFDILPLALDDSIDARRSAEKMIADPTVKAIVGPLTPQSWALTKETVADVNLPWIAPFAIGIDGGFGAPNGDNASTTLFLQTIARTIQKSGRQQLVIGGLPVAIDLQLDWSRLTDLDIKLLDLNVESADKIVSGDAAVLWLGDAAKGAQFANEIWGEFPDIVFWTGTQGADPVFVERLTQPKAYYWAGWSNENYDSWKATHQPSSLAAYHSYLATQSAIAQLALPTAAQSAVATIEPPWFVQCFQVDAQLETRPFRCDLQ